MSEICSTRLETLEGLAKTMEPDPVFRAAWPQAYTDEPSEYLQDIADRFPINQVVDFAAEKHNIDPARLSSLGIRLHGNTLEEACLKVRPEYRQGLALHYPVIDIAVGPKIPSKLTDFHLRHELRHIFQKDAIPLYARPEAGKIVRGVGIVGSVACAAAMIKNHGTIFIEPEHYSGIPLNVVGSIASGVSVGCALGGWRMPWIFSKHEVDAHIFALRNRSFQPFTCMRR